MDRRQVLGWGAGLVATGLAPPVFAEDMDADGVLSTDPREAVPLWPEVPPGGAGLNIATQVIERSTKPAEYHDRAVVSLARPSLTVFRPQRPNGAAVLLAPGGGYLRIVLDKEGYETARYLNARGVTVFILRYRLPFQGWRNRQAVPLQDAQRAMRLIRYFANHFAIDPARLGVMGFSAGGHVAASLATLSGREVYAPIDAADAVDARPAFACLIYPVVTMGEGCHQGSRDSLLGENPSTDLVREWSCQQQVTAQMPPTFLAFSADDDAVPAQSNAVAMFRALLAAKVRCEMHGFEVGGHGYGIRLAANKPCAAWPDLFAAWARGRGLITA